MLDKYFDVIVNVSLFYGIERTGIANMLNCLKPRVGIYKKGDYIVTSGQTYENVGVVLKGTATVSKESISGNRIVMTLLKERDIFGEIVAFSSMATWPATVQAQEACEILFLPRSKIVGDCDKMCSWHRIFIQNFLRVISERAIVLNKKVEYLTIKSIRGKICSFLLDHYNKSGSKEIELALNRNELADFLNVSRPSMSREMSKMKEEGVIDFHLSTFRIIDLQALKAMSEL
ncbi:Crp/Fnr family transcriptional regulator [Desulfosporosinus hippei]|uniref:cAMP-binding domain of CRP or a regulatory subunit of cAMP-dependent protein kinases n=1 Tax=Desulfosporosinus hippei DSM 8344 TaxID=1121419 RepID=A0A1G8JER9_9FIRM|nr:Crp/Fnr family transcriptional regulator [Desulfosporosinus hippei]SDI29705.1 cAMP-binding domain of CRP or a regulatory subunit of cAMP-dependent protein kinases [Desulfosporosinus hippei DSM 8344]